MKLKSSRQISFFLIFLFFSLSYCFAQKISNRNEQDKEAFINAISTNWKEVFYDSGHGNWKDKWFLDGDIGSASNGEKGMQLTAGPKFLNDAHHMVLWTKKEFEGDVKIEFDFTRLDFETRCVNILYIQATGSGNGSFAKDITKWNDYRQVSAMNRYYDYMHTYHISFSANPNFEEARGGYIRARRYMPHSTGLKGTKLTPDYFPKDFFKPGDIHHITVIKNDRDIYMKVSNSKKTIYCHFSNENLPIIKEGRIGLRLMFTRSSLFSNFKISELED